MKIELVSAAADDIKQPCPRLQRGMAMGFQPGLDAGGEIALVLSTLLKHPRPARWGTFWVASPELRAWVGICGFKDEPGPQGEVELAYFTFPALEGRGIATASVYALVRHALRFGVKMITARTLCVPNASCTVLKRNGFVFAGEVSDPEDGQVWLWELPR